MARFKITFTEMFLGKPSTKIVPLIKMAARSKIEKRFNRHLLLGQ